MKRPLAVLVLLTIVSALFGAAPAVGDPPLCPRGWERDRATVEELRFDRNGNGIICRRETRRRAVVKDDFLR